MAALCLMKGPNPPQSLQDLEKDRTADFGTVSGLLGIIFGALRLFFNIEIPWTAYNGRILTDKPGAIGRRPLYLPHRGSGPVRSQSFPAQSARQVRPA